MPDDVATPTPVPVPGPTPTPSAKGKAQESATVAAAATPTPSPVAAPCPKCQGTREVMCITMKRKNISLTGDDKFGHWWTELGDDESYGWWPAEPLSEGGGLPQALGRTMTGVKGDLNGQAMFGGNPTQDPHHGDPAEESFHPKVGVCDTRTDDEIKDCIRGYAKSYSGEWRWTFGFGQNCHTFQEGLMSHCGLSE